MGLVARRPEDVVMERRRVAILIGPLAIAEMFRQCWEMGRQMQCDHKCAVFVFATSKCTSRESLRPPNLPLPSRLEILIKY